MAIKKFFFFIVVLRALSAIIITNAHYTNVYPYEIIANGGLLGDVLFFSISGFCLCNVKETFSNWFKRRAIRVYTPTLIATLVYVLLGCYEINDVTDAAKLFVWPTYYHFVGSIILLYMPFYFFVKHIELNTNNFEKLSLSLLALQVLIYFTVYDASYYHIDKVREPMIWFLFLQSMLLGAYYRNVTEGERPPVSKIHIRIGILLIVCYFVSKLIFVKFENISQFQILNQIILFLLLWATFRIFYAWEDKFKNMPQWIYKIAKYLADRTLEIYLVQYVLIFALDTLTPFPLNWFVVTGSILASAHMLHWVSDTLLKKIGF